MPYPRQKYDNLLEFELHEGKACLLGDVMSTMSSLYHILNTFDQMGYVCIIQDYLAKISASVYKL